MKFKQIACFAECLHDLDNIKKCVVARINKIEVLDKGFWIYLLSIFFSDK